MIYVIKDYYGKEDNGYFVPTDEKGDKVFGHIFCSGCVRFADPDMACASPLMSYTKKELSKLIVRSCVFEVQRPKSCING